jgi:prenyltransferase beta subunit
MKRLAIVLTCLFAAPSIHAGEPGVKQSIAYLQKLQTDSGGFRASEPKAKEPKGEPTLRATSAAVRALKYLGGDVPNKAACIKFVETCWNAEAGGFSDEPKGKADVFCTAVGLMAVAELKMPTEKYAKSAVKYLSENAKSFEEIRMAAAGFEAIGAKSDKHEAWIREITKGRNPDGSYGKGEGKYRATAGSVVTILRLGGKVDDTENARKILFHGQRPGGGFINDAGKQDLESSYRIMRFYHMIKDFPPSSTAMRQFVAKCKNADGGYGIAPEQPSSVSGTYFAAIITHWLKQ